ncbi:hypothetical protein ml_485 [Mollivirus sibericum]|uniref:hypothetical protein n=1 Tax=Mollivirus sibericum TaxID=1678078 RepID=UPI0006B2E61C|nr:hypothetical protein ml_485 [Mollivirus sibericum]ALD62287.1 hypothetical protein ml_485 [Mollivirus sibericum]
MDHEEVRPCKRARLDQEEEEEQRDLLTYLSHDYGHVIVRVASFLCLKDVVSMVCASKALVEILRDDAQTWRSLICAVSIKVDHEVAWDSVEPQEAIRLASLGALGPLLPLANNMTHITMNHDMSLAKSHIDEALRLVRTIRRMSYVHDNYLEVTLPVCNDIHPTSHVYKKQRQEDILHINSQVMAHMDGLMVEAFEIVVDRPLPIMAVKWMRACSFIYGAPREHLEHEGMTSTDYCCLREMWKKLCARAGKHMSSVAVNLVVWFTAVSNALIQETNNPRMRLLQPSKALGLILGSFLDLAVRDESRSVHARALASPLYKAVCREEQACANALQRLFVNPCRDKDAVSVFVYSARSAMGRGLAMPASFDSPLNFWLCKVAVLAALSFHSDDLHVVCDVVQLVLKVPRFWHDPHLASLLLQLLRDQNLDYMVEECSDATKSDMKRVFICMVEADTDQARRSKLLDCIDIINK